MTARRVEWTRRFVGGGLSACDTYPVTSACAVAHSSEVKISRLHIFCRTVTAKRSLVAVTLTEIIS